MLCVFRYHKYNLPYGSFEWAAYLIFYISSDSQLVPPNVQKRVNKFHLVFHLVFIIRGAFRCQVSHISTSSDLIPTVIYIVAKTNSDQAEYRLFLTICLHTDTILTYFHCAYTVLNKLAKDPHFTTLIF